MQIVGAENDMSDLNKERRAYDLLQWVPYSLHASFNERLADAGYYTKLQRERSDFSLDAWDEERLYVSGSELTAFKELERLGIYSQSHFYSPTEAKENGKYTARLKEHLSRSLKGSQIPSRRTGKTRRHGPL